MENPQLPSFAEILQPYTIGVLPCIYREGNGTPLQYSSLENPMDGGAWQAAVHGVAEGRTRLHFYFSLSCIGEGNGNLLQCSCLENPRDREAWWAAVYGVAQSWTRLKRHSIAQHPCIYGAIKISSYWSETRQLCACVCLSLIWGTTMHTQVTHSISSCGLSVVFIICSEWLILVTLPRSFLMVGATSEKRV